MTDQQQKTVGRRFLEDFEQGVGGVAVHVVGIVDDNNPPAALRSGQAQEPADAADVIDHDLGARPALPVLHLPVDGKEIRMAPRNHATEYRIVLDTSPVVLDRELEAPVTGVRFRERVEDRRARLPLEQVRYTLGQESVAIRLGIQERQGERDPHER